MKITKLIPIIVIILFMLLAWWFGLTKYFNFETIKENRNQLLDYVQSYPVLAPLSFIAIYTCITALSIPVAIYMTLLGGFLFPQPFSTLYVVIGATLGASILFIAASTALKDVLRERAGSRLEKMRQGFQENAAGYLLFLRLIPLFPFWLVNIAPAFFEVPFFTFFWTTALGITPGAFVYSQVGTGLGSIFESGEEFTIDKLLNQDVKIAFVALGVFILIPTIYRTWKKWKKEKSEKF